MTEPERLSRSRAKITDADIERLLELERLERERLYRESEIWGAHRTRLLCICLGQGGARHLIDGRNGIKDFDLWTFFARRDDLPQRSLDSAFRSPRKRDFGRSRFGVRTDAYFRRKFPTFAGRSVDIFGVAIPARLRQDPAEAVRAWLTEARTERAELLAKKPFVMLEPRRLEVIWPVDACSETLRGYAG